LNEHKEQLTLYATEKKSHILDRKVVAYQSIVFVRWRQQLKNRCHQFGRMPLTIIRKVYSFIHSFIGLVY